MIDDDFAALYAMGLTPLAFTEGAPEMVARDAALRALTAEVQQAHDSAEAQFIGSDFASAANLVAAVDAAGQMAQSAAALADLAAA